MELRYTTGLDDHMAFYDYSVNHAQKRDAQFARILFTVLSVPAGFVLALVISWLLWSDHSVTFQFIGFGSVMTIWFGGLLFPTLTGLFMGISTYRQYPKNSRKQNCEKLTKIYTDDDGVVRDKDGWLQITPETLNSKDVRLNHQIFWPAVDRVVTTPDHTFIFFIEAMVFIVPKAKVEEGDYDAFLENLYEQLS